MLIGLLLIRAGAQPVNPAAGTAAGRAIQNPGVVSWVHIGDLHITPQDQQSYADFQTLIKHINQFLLNSINFACLPGDNANDSLESEYQLIRQATDQLRVPLYAVPGDHDLKSGSLALYQKYMEPVAWQSSSIDRYHLVFLNGLDASPSGGFGLSEAQTAWLRNDLDAATRKGLQSVLFLHAFPSVLRNSTQVLLDLIQQHRIPMVEVGHTHYNAVANDNHTIYAATRSTGQISEGPVGFSITNLDNGVVSWKFKPLGSWPFVMITSPADKLFIIDPGQAVRGAIDVHAKIWGAQGVASATLQIDGQAPRPLSRIGTTPMWSARWDSTKVGDGDHQMTVTVQDSQGTASQDKITVLVHQSGAYQPSRRNSGDQGNSIGAYPGKGLLGTTGKQKKGDGKQDGKQKKDGGTLQERMARTRERLARAKTNDPAAKQLEESSRGYLADAEQLLARKNVQAAGEMAEAADTLSRAVDHLGHAEDLSKKDFPGREEQLQHLEKVAAQVQQVDPLQNQTKDPKAKPLAALAKEFYQRARQAYDRQDARYADEYTKVADEIAKCLEHLARAAKAVSEPPSLK